MTNDPTVKDPTDRVVLDGEEYHGSSLDEALARGQAALDEIPPSPAA